MRQGWRNMRGRTLNNAYIILDEAQNCTCEQMKMFLTRFGEGSRVVVTGDITQIDLPREKKSGLVHALRYRDVEGISQVYLTHKDVVRHEMAQRIIRAYDRAGRLPAGTRQMKDSEEGGLPWQQRERKTKPGVYKQAVAGGSFDPDPTFRVFCGVGLY